MDRNWEVKVKPNCNAQFLIIDKMFALISGIKSKEKGVNNNLTFTGYEDVGVLSDLRKIFMDDWENSYGIYSYNTY